MDLMKFSKGKDFKHIAILKEDSLDYLFEDRSNEECKSAAALAEEHIFHSSKSRKRKPINKAIAEESAIEGIR